MVDPDQNQHSFKLHTRNFNFVVRSGSGFLRAKNKGLQKSYDVVVVVCDVTIVAIEHGL